MRIQGSERSYAETKISTTRGAEGEGEPGVMRAADFGELVLLGDETAIRLAGQVRGRGVRFSVVLVLSVDWSLHRAIVPLLTIHSGKRLNTPRYWGKGIVG